MDTIRAWMSSPAICTDAASPLDDARRLMRDHQVRRLPVIDSSGALVGMVTAGDIERALRSSEARGGHPHRPTSLPVGAVMSSPALSVTPDTPALDAARLLLEHRIGGLPVVEGGQVVGVVTESDLFRALVPSNHKA